MASSPNKYSFYYIKLLPMESKLGPILGVGVDVGPKNSRRGSKSCALITISTNRAKQTLRAYSFPVLVLKIFPFLSVSFAVRSGLLSRCFFSSKEPEWLPKRYGFPGVLSMRASVCVKSRDRAEQDKGDVALRR